jgi:hypothetical protein
MKMPAMRPDVRDVIAYLETCRVRPEQNRR